MKPGLAMKCPWGLAFRSAPLQPGIVPKGRMCWWLEVFPALAGAGAVLALVLLGKLRDRQLQAFPAR